jgi:hypothetical protein
MRRTANRQTNTQPDELLGLVEMLAEWAVEDYLHEQQVQPQPKNQQRRTATPRPEKAKK